MTTPEGACETTVTSHRWRHRAIIPIRCRPVVASTERYNVTSFRPRRNGPREAQTGPLHCRPAPAHKHYTGPWHTTQTKDTTHTTAGPSTGTRTGTNKA